MNRVTPSLLRHPLSRSGRRKVCGRPPPGPGAADGRSGRSAVWGGACARVRLLADVSCLRSSGSQSQSSLVWRGSATFGRSFCEVWGGSSDGDRRGPHRRRRGNYTRITQVAHSRHEPGHDSPYDSVPVCRHGEPSTWRLVFRRGSGLGSGRETSAAGIVAGRSAIIAFGSRSEPRRSSRATPVLWFGTARARQRAGRPSV